MNDFDIKKFLTENKMTRNSRLNENIDINGNTPIPTEQWKKHYQELIDLIEEVIEDITEKDKPRALSTIKYMKQGIETPPHTLDEALKWWEDLEKIMGYGFDITKNNAYLFADSPLESAVEIFGKNMSKLDIAKLKNYIKNLN